MRKFLYLSLIDRLKQLTEETGEPVIKTFDLWNEQVEYIEQEEAFLTPATFIEFMPVKWTGGGTQQADVTLRLHIITAWNGSARDGSTGSSTNHNHEELVEDITDFTCRVIDKP